jgi:hypothetical protein
MKTGRPTKMNAEMITAMEIVIAENVLFCTDEELVLLVNEKLPLDLQFSFESYSKWKRGESQNENMLFKDFLRLVKRALITEKITLLKNLQSGVINWQSRAWILERKFDEWNIRSKAIIDFKVEKLTEDEITAILNRLIKQNK